jgi:hypothetical protein
VSVAEALGSIPASRSIVRPTAFQARYIWVPSHEIHLTGNGAEPARNTATGLLEFSGSADQAISGIFQVPHTWWEGTAMLTFLHLRFPIPAVSPNADSKWRIDVSTGNLDGAFSRSYGATTGGTKLKITNPNNALAHRREQITGPWMGALGTYSISLGAMWILKRFAATDAEDTDSGAIALLGLMFVFGVDSVGSLQLNLKS